MVAYLREHGFPWAERRALAGVNDLGDVVNVPGVCIEVKDHKRWDVAGWVDEMLKEKANAHALIGVVVIPRTNHGIERAYVVQELRQWVETVR